MIKPRILGLLCSCVFAFLSYLSGSAWAVSYTLIDLGTFDGGINDINDSGHVVGWRYINDDRDFHAFLYDGNTMQDLGTLGGSSSYGNGINNSGQVVGYSNTVDGGTHAFLYGGSAMQDLGTLGSGTTSGLDINNNGQVLGTVTYDYLDSNAFLYDGSTIQELGTLGGRYSLGRSINDSGQVVGESEAGIYIRAFLYDGSTMQDLGTLGGPDSRGLDINNSGQVVGTSETDEYTTGSLGLSIYTEHAFFYDGSAMHDLGTLGGRYSEAFGINDIGQVVGKSQIDGEYGDNSYYHAFLYDGSTMLDLCAISDCREAGWDRLESATAINSHGEITGNGIIGGQNHAYLAIPSIDTTPTSVDLSGTIKTADGTNVCAIVLASGQFTFSCKPIGVFSLNDLPRENNATVKRQIYADGFIPKINILQGTTDEMVVMNQSGDCTSYNSPYDPSIFPDSAGKWVDISGYVLERHTQTPVCALVLANGHYIFSCDGTGIYSLNIPLDSNGQYKLQVYADGFASAVQNFDEFSTANDVRMARATECR